MRLSRLWCLGERVTAAESAGRKSYVIRLRSIPYPSRRLSHPMASKNPKANKKSGSGVDAGTQRSLAVVQDAATRDSNQSMKQAIEITLKIFQNAQVCTSGSGDHSLTI